MSNKMKVTVKIFGQEYTMVGCEPREYMQKVANYVDDKMIDVARNSKKLSTSMVAVLTALNIADEYFKTKEKCDRLEVEVQKPQQELDYAQSQLATTVETMESMEEEYKEIIRRIEQEQRNQSTISDDEYQKLLQMVECMKEELQSRDDELEKANKINEELQNKLFDMQIKYVQSRKELEAFIDTFDGEMKKRT